MATNEVRIEVTGEAKNAERSLKKVQDSVKRLGTAAGEAGRSLIALSAPLTAFAAISVKTFAGFEQSMARVRAVSDATQAEFELLTKAAKTMGETTQFTAREAAEALSFMAMAGMNARTAAAALPNVLQLAAAGALELGSAADIVTNVMAGMQLQVKDLGRANDVLVTAFTSTNTNLEQLGQAFKFAGPVAKAAGISFEETTAALALMGNAGIQASMAGTALRGAITRLLNPTKEAQQVISRLGLTVTDTSGKFLPFQDIIGQLEQAGLTAADAMTVFGQRAGPGMLALLSQGSDALKDLTERMLESGGTAERIAKQQLETLTGQFKLLMSAVEGASIELGEALVPNLLKIIEVSRPVTKTLTDLIRVHETLTTLLAAASIAITAFGVALVGLGLLLPGAVTGVGALMKAFSALIALKWGSLIIALDALTASLALLSIKVIAAAALIWLLTAAVRGILNQLDNWINDTQKQTDAIEIMIDDFKRAKKAVKDFAGAMADAFTPAMDEATVSTDNLIASLSNIGPGMRDAVAAGQELYGSLAQLEKIADDAADSVDDAADRAGAAVGPLGDLAVVMGDVGRVAHDAVFELAGFGIPLVKTRNLFYDLNTATGRAAAALAGFKSELRVDEAIKKQWKDLTEIGNKAADAMTSNLAQVVLAKQKADREAVEATRQRHLTEFGILQDMAADQVRLDEEKQDKLKKIQAEADEEKLSAMRRLQNAMAALARSPVVSAERLARIGGLGPPPLPAGAAPFYRAAGTGISTVERLERRRRREEWGREEGFTGPAPTVIVENVTVVANIDGEDMMTSLGHSAARNPE